MSDRVGIGPTLFWQSREPVLESTFKHHGEQHKVVEVVCEHFGGWLYVTEHIQQE